MAALVAVLKRGLVLVPLLVVSLGVAPLASAAAGTWSPTGSMTTPRAHHTATLLNSGQVLAAGGNNPHPFGGASASAEQYDPNSGTWSPIESMAVGRTRHTATLLDDGRVLVAGGFDAANNVLASLELYDPTTQTWSPAGTLTTARTNHTATLLLDGRVLFAGGEDAAKRATATAELYDPASGTSTPTGSLLAPRLQHTATLLGDGTVLAAGGGPGADVYDPDSGTWSPTGPMAVQRSFHTATLLNDGTVLVAGGLIPVPGGTGITETAEVYDPATQTWALTGSMHYVRDVHRATLLDDGTVLVLGSADGGGYANGEVYDPTAGSWTVTDNLITGRPGGHTATLLLNGQVLVAGGVIQDATRAELYVSALASGPTRVASAPAGAPAKASVPASQASQAAAQASGI